VLLGTHRRSVVARGRPSYPLGLFEPSWAKAAAKARCLPLENQLAANGWTTADKPGRAAAKGQPAVPVRASFLPFFAHAYNQREVGPFIRFLAVRGGRERAGVTAARHPPKLPVPPGGPEFLKG